MNSAVTTVVVFALIIGMTAIALSLDDTDQTLAESPLGLTSTKITLEVGETSELTFWSLPAGKTEASVGWSSDDESVATVSYGTVTAVSAGTSTVTASVFKDGKEYKDTCLVTVSATPVESGLTVYNPYSEQFDSAVLTGKGFVGDATYNGVLSLTFNQGGYVIIAVAGSTYTWQPNNYVRIDMTISWGTNQYTARYYPQSSSNPSQFVTENGITYNQTAQSPSLYVKGLDYGTYTVTFTVYKESFPFPTALTSTTGTFTYSEGDGRYDATSEYSRTYGWQSQITGTNVSCRLDVTYSYAEYWNAMMKSINGLYHYRNGVASARYEEECVNFMNTGKTVTDLEAALRTLYENKYPSLVDNSSAYAQFIFSFIQIRFFYEADYTLYDNCDSSHSTVTDVWAYPDMTVYSGLGDCEDTSLLLTSLFKVAGYDTALILLPSHMMGCLALSDYGYEASFEYGGKKYYFCESTANNGVRIGYYSSDFEYEEFTYYFV